MRRYLKFLALITAMLSGCSDDNENVKPKTTHEVVEIAVLEAAATGRVGEQFEIRVRTVPNNGCWGNVSVTLSQDDDHHYTLRADGTFTVNNPGVCPDNLIVEDTIIRVSPSVAGAYYFKANSEPYVVLRDTVEVE